jgi:hypothetical protein
MSTTKEVYGKEVHDAATLVPACRCEVVERGPNWLFVRVELSGDPCGVGERLWEIARSQFIYRLVVEFDASAHADATHGSTLGHELGTLCDRLTERGGALRLCGLSPEAAHAVVSESGCPRLHNHMSAHDAVWCGPRCDGVNDAAEQTVRARFDEETWRSPPRPHVR